MDIFLFISLLLFSNLITAAYVTHLFEKKEKEEKAREEEREREEIISTYEKMLRNVQNFDGTGKGQINID